MRVMTYEGAVFLRCIEATHSFKIMQSPAEEI